VDRRKDSQLGSSSQGGSPTTNLTKSALTLVEKGAAGSMSVRFVGNSCGPRAIVEAYNHMSASVPSRGEDRYAIKDFHGTGVTLENLMQR
jgi:hypothetical protein